LLAAAPALVCFLGAANAESQPATEKLPREQWGAPRIAVKHEKGKWIIAGKKQQVELDDTNLALQIRAAATTWNLLPSGAEDLLVKSDGKESHVGLATLPRTIEPYDTGFKTGVKLTCGGERQGLTLYLTICLEGRDEEVVFEIAARESSAVMRRLDWPPALDAREVDHTLLSNGKGNLLPRDWPKEYFPIRRMKDGKIDPADHTVLQSHVIESWSMSWWGFQKGKSAMMLIVQTPDDAAYQFEHPPGGPTVIGPRWLATLGKFRLSTRCSDVLLRARQLRHAG
jgi:hypothetical protein